MASDEVTGGYGLWAWVAAAGGSVIAFAKHLVGREVSRVDRSLDNHGERINTLERTAVNQESLEKTITRVTTDFKQHVDTVAAGIHQRIDDVHRMLPKRGGD